MASDESDERRLKANWFSSADRVLAARIEAAESENLMRMTEALAAVQPDAAFEPFAGGVAVFAGVGSGMTHAVGIGMRFVPEAELERMEGFFRDRGSSCIIDLCPLADESVIGYVQSKPYRVVELNNVLVRRLTPEEQLPVVEGVEFVPAEQMEKAARVILSGFSEGMPFSEETVRVMAPTLEVSRTFIASEDPLRGDTEPIAGAAVGIRNGVALFYGDATLPGSRRQGWQLNLINARLKEAQREGCDLAVVSVLPGSGSHRNYERAGFQLMYMRVNLCREF